MNQIIISRLFNVDEYFLFSRGGACPQDGWVNDETGEGKKTASRFNSGRILGGTNDEC